MGYGYDLIKAKTPEEAIAKAPYEIGQTAKVSKLRAAWAGDGRWSVWPEFELEPDGAKEDQTNGSERIQPPPD